MNKLSEQNSFVCRGLTVYETNPAPSTGSSGTLSSKQQAPLPPRDLALQGVASRRHKHPDKAASCLDWPE